MPQRLLQEDWENYDNRKIRDNRDKQYFSCEEAWEVDYLVEVIRKYKINPEEEIRKAIASSCRSVPAPRPRKAFVVSVMDELAKQ